VTAVPGLTPRSPVMTVGPALVTVEAPRTAKLCTEPSGGADYAQAKLPTLSMSPARLALSARRRETGRTSEYPAVSV
jgi:hypothetical protein